LLPAADLARLLRIFSRVEIKPRQVLHHWRMPMEYAFFVESGLVSVASRIDRETFVEVWLVGSEGMLGLPVVLAEGDDPPHRRVVQVGGSCLKAPMPDFRKAVEEMPSLQRLLMRYARVVLLQTSQSGACNAHHEVKQRLCRWLLFARDALERDELPVTHEVLGRLLGVRRASVSECLGVLESELMVETRRGRIRIADPVRLEAACCDCYRLIKHEYQRLLLPTPAIRSAAE
jgi:CRP-like cAMP-binding protein